MTDSLHGEPSAGGKKCSECQFEQSHSQACSKRTWGLAPTSNPKEEKCSFLNCACRYSNNCECHTQKAPEGTFHASVIAPFVWANDDKKIVPHQISPRYTADSKESENERGDTHILTDSEIINAHSRAFDEFFTPPSTEQKWRGELERVFGVTKDNLGFPFQNLLDFISTLISKERQKALNSDAIRELKIEFHRRGRTETKAVILKLIENKIERINGQYDDADMVVLEALLKEIDTI